MPGWHDATKELEAEGAMRTVGIVLEQHPARTRLFMQWKQMHWPVMVDSLNLLGLKVVPVTLLIDEQGIVRFRGKREHLERFLALPPPDGDTAAAPAARPSLAEPETPSAAALRRWADDLFLWGGADGIDRAIDTYMSLLADEPQHGPTHFRLGVAHLRRYDSPRRRDGDFHSAVEHWGIALAIDPNQYIWRRRIQQYGPRLMKPYPFYDWVDDARREIAARGETPAALAVDLRGAEIARPAKRFVAEPDRRASPDPQGRITRDEKGFVQVEQTAVPAVLSPGDAGRLHLVFRPGAGSDSHWNNEAEDMVFWVDPPPGWSVDRRHSSVPNPPEPVSDEERRIEIEVQSPAGASGTFTLPAYALYYVCEDVRGSCLYRRQDVPLRLEVDVH